jgi:multicomponent Na+:H+ antiporter subunit E
VRQAQPPSALQFTGGAIKPGVFCAFVIDVSKWQSGLRGKNLDRGKIVVTPKLQTLQRFGLFLAAWIVLTSADLEALPFGAVVAVGGTGIADRLMPRGEGLRLQRLAAMVPAFLVRSVIGGLDVARRALSPGLPINPGWIAHPLRIKGGTLRVLLGGEISLLPGTLAAGCSLDRLLIHCLDVDLPVARRITKEESKLARVVKRA